MFSIGEVVEWTSQAAGRSKTKQGVVVAYVAPGERPDRLQFPDLYKNSGCGLGRSVESWVVKVGNKHYWPNGAKLVREAACPWCNGTGLA